MIENVNLHAMQNRIGQLDSPINILSSIEGLDMLGTRLRTAGGISQQNRMIFDKKRSFDRVKKSSYQGANVKKVDEKATFRALINPNRLKADYDEKVISIDYESGFSVGDIFEWKNTGTYWIIELQDLTELAYFRGDIRKCVYEINWEKDGKRHSTYAAVRGPVETKIDSVQKHGAILDEPNYSLSLLLPASEEIIEQFKRYGKFYLANAKDSITKQTCWRVEATDSISVPGILEVHAVEYYSNKDEDDVEQGIVGGLISEKKDPNLTENINGDTFIKPKEYHTYKYFGSERNKQWKVDNNLVELIPNDQEVKLKWFSNYSGQFVLTYGRSNKTIVVESLF